MWSFPLLNSVQSSNEATSEQLLCANTSWLFPSAGREKEPRIHRFSLHFSHSLFDYFFFWQFRVCWCGTPSLTRSRVCSFQFLLGIASAAFLRSESHGTHEHILFSLFLRLPPPGGARSCFYSPQEEGSPIKLGLSNQFTYYYNVISIVHICTIHILGLF
jgi:hypothetical protein